MIMQTICLDGPWVGKTINHEPGDHEARAVTESYKKGRDRGFASFHGVYEWTPVGWTFREGMPVVSR